MIFVSEGFTATLPAQLNDPVAAMPGVGNPTARRPTPQTPTTDAARARGDFMNQTDLLTDMRDVFDTANRQNTSIYAVDPARARRVRVRHQRRRQLRRSTATI